MIIMRHHHAMKHPIANDGRWTLAISSNTPDDVTGFLRALCWAMTRN